jgi:hypothetical protein
VDKGSTNGKNDADDETELNKRAWRFPCFGAVPLLGLAVWTLAAGRRER